jgi:hypothetical protein
MPEPDVDMQSRVVQMILDRRTEEALQVLSLFYKVRAPEIAVGTVKGKRRSAYAVYVAKEEKIYASTSDIFYNPFIILHEFYHHIRSRGGLHRGTEKYANLYARRFIDAYVLSERAKHQQKANAGR